MRPVTCAIPLALLYALLCNAATASGQMQHIALAPVQAQPGSAPTTDQAAASSDDLRQGIALSRTAHFTDAIPYLRRAAATGSSYAANFNLALCYVATEQYAQAVAVLRTLQADGHDTAPVNNLLAQAYLGQAEPEQAWAAMLSAARLAPLDERLYALLADACTDHSQYTLGLRVAELGLRSLPQSARLHYERAVLLARLDRFDEARPEFANAATLGAGSDLGYLATVQAELYDDRFAEAATVARAAIANGDHSAEMLALLGSILLQAGAIPGHADFEEARQVLETAVLAQPNYSTAQIALGSLYLREGRVADAIPHLEAGSRMEPENPAVYTHLAEAYRKVGDMADAAACTRRLGQLLSTQQPPAAPAP